MQDIIAFYNVLQVIIYRVLQDYLALSFICFENCSIDLLKIRKGSIYYSHLLLIYRFYYEDIVVRDSYTLLIIHPFIVCI